MRAVDIIALKRDGLALSAEQIDRIVQGYTQGTIPDYQVAAWLMAIVLQGMDRQETIDLTMSMARSGEQLDLSEIAGSVADKHSTGGVGDKTTLVVAPLVATAGAFMGKMSGRGLGFTGGTLDKLESIPGFRSDLSTDEFLTQLADLGIVVTGQSADLAPADGKFYALRDVTATVNSLPLIASSIMSKKIATGSTCIVLDVKVGSGAFMETLAEAEELANLMVDIGCGMGRKVRAVISDMGQPLGNAVGNALELLEALDTLAGRGPEDFRQLCLTVASQMIILSGLARDDSEARALLEPLLTGGQALAKFREMVVAQGGDGSYLDNPGKLPRARFVEEVPAPETGYVSGLNARAVGMTSMLLGGGRAKKGDSVDHAVGIVLRAKVGDRVEKGQPLLTLHANDSAKLSGAKQQLLAAYDWSEEPVSAPRLIHLVVG
jgi:pyrimidine-nucleoside phosphorylase